MRKGRVAIPTEFLPRYMQFINAKWIWVENVSNPDTYGEFYDEFNWEQGEVNCRISCDGDYTLFVNGQYVASNQYGDYEWYKAYDSINLTPYLKKGKNSFAVVVWHFGFDSQRYLKASPGLIFEVSVQDKILISSGEKTLSRYSKAYKSGQRKLITRQLGYSFFYDATQEDDWLISGKDFQFATIVNKNCCFVERPIAKLELLECVHGVLIGENMNHYVFDLGKETVGLASLNFVSDIPQKIRVDWGEDLQGGHVRRCIEHRDFSFEYIAKAGVNQYTNYMLRLGCRYLEVYTEAPIEIKSIGLIPQIYPVKENKVQLDNLLDRQIYDTCLNTLKLCMMEHYVDTPWREQCLYVFDSRNQMLCGYYAFEDGNVDYVRANLKLIAQDKRGDGLLSICYPCGMDLTIPSFTLYYFAQVNEYLQYTGDVEFVQEVYDKLISIIDVFVNNRKNGLVLKFEGKNHWNFYDWSPYLDGALHGTEEVIPDLMVNLLFIYALRNLQDIDEKLGHAFAYEEILKESTKCVKEAFYCKDTGLYSMTIGGGEYTVLGNSLAVLLGLSSGSESEYICEKIALGELHECSLSMRIFKYDALLLVNENKWKNFILDELRRDYKKMMDDGATSVWETIDGAAAFENAGSLCHGWTAIPIYYFNRLKVIRTKN